MRDLEKIIILEGVYDSSGNELYRAKEIRNGEMLHENHFGSFSDYKPTNKRYDGSWVIYEKR